VTTAAELRGHTVKDLAAMAKRKRVAGWHSMRKDDLVKALVKCLKAEAPRRGKGKSAQGSANRSAGASNGASRNGKAGSRTSRRKRSDRKLQQIRARLAEAKDLAFKSISDVNGRIRDRLVVMVRDPYWLHAYWEISRRAIERARAAMGQHWHGARPVLRLCQVEAKGTTNAARRLVRDIEVHGGVNNWYIDVHDPPKSYQVEIGYLAGDKYFCLARSNVVTTPNAASGDAFDHNWAEVAKDFDRIYAMSVGYNEHEASHELKEIFEEQLRRPIGDPIATQFGSGASADGDRRRDFSFQVDAELIVHGVTEPSAHVTLRGEPVPLRPDGSFAVRFNLPDRRHVLPVVASSGDGSEQHTIVLAVDRNTKVMEPVIRAPGD
jgi:hypothetical protein